MIANAGAKLAALAVIHEHVRHGTLASALDATGVDASPPGQFWRVHRLAILFWREYVAAGGLVLDADLWRIEAGAVNAVAQAVEWGFVHGSDGFKTAAQFLYLSGTSADVLRADLSHPIDEYTSFQDVIFELFCEAINFSFRAVQDITSPE